MLAAAVGVVVPVAAQAMELGGLADLEETIAAVRESLGHDGAVTAILACRVRTGTTLARDVIDQLRKQHEQLVLDAIIRENVRVAEAYAWQEPSSPTTRPAPAPPYTPSRPSSATPPSATTKPPAPSLTPRSSWLWDEG